MEEELEKAWEESTKALKKFQDRLEGDKYGLSKVEAVRVTTEILNSMPQVFTPHGLNEYIYLAKTGKKE